MKTIASKVPIAEIMTREVVSASADLGVHALAKLFVDHHIGCVPIVDSHGRPQGIVTKSDLVENLEKPSSIAADVMMPLAITLDERATVADAAAMFISEDFHHVMIVSSAGVLIGIVSTKDIVRWLYENDRAHRT